MQDRPDLIDIEVAAQGFQLKTSTLERYIEAGHLKLEQHLGQAYLHIEELEKLFGPLRCPPCQKTTPLNWALAAEDSAAPCLPQIPEDLGDSLTDAPHITADPDSPLIRECQRLDSLLSFQKELLEKHSSDLSDLREQRDWLRKRIEKSEEQINRNQILQLSETKLLNYVLESQ